MYLFKNMNTTNTMTRILLFFLFQWRSKNQKMCFGGNGDAIQSSKFSQNFYFYLLSEESKTLHFSCSDLLSTIQYGEFDCSLNDNDIIFNITLYAFSHLISYEYCSRLSLSLFKSACSTFLSILTEHIIMTFYVFDSSHQITGSYLQ